jgi:methionyl-tRNA formyltransferase
MPRIVLIGLYQLGARSLEALLARGLEVVGVVTKPDPRVEEEPLARLARSRGIPVFLPARPGEPGFVEQVRGLRPEVLVVTGYHKVLPAKLLAIPPRGVLNLHGSLLPRHRGPVPWKWAILNGESVGGMTVQVMGAELDRGPLLAQESCPIAPDDTGETLFAKLCLLAGPLLARTLPAFLDGNLTPVAQDERQATYEGYPTEDDACISWEWEAERILNLIRGLSPRPGAWTCFRGMKLRVRKAVRAEESPSRDPGLILHQSGGTVVVATGKGNLLLSEISVDGETLTLEPLRLQLLGLTPGSLLRSTASEAPLNLC